VAVKTNLHRPISRFRAFSDFRKWSIAFSGVTSQQRRLNLGGTSGALVTIKRSQLGFTANSFVGGAAEEKVRRNLRLTSRHAYVTYCVYLLTARLNVNYLLVAMGIRNGALRFIRIRNISLYFTGIFKFQKYIYSVHWLSGHLRDASGPIATRSDAEE
jgi:hypothetical protein